MKHKLIKTDNYLLVVDESEIKEGDYVLTNLMEIVVFNKPSTPSLYKKIIAHLPINKIIAHLPINAPILEGVPLLPPIEDEVEPDPKLIDSMAMRYRHDFGLLEKQHQDSIRTTMIQLWGEVVGKGFYKAKEKYKYTEEEYNKLLSFIKKIDDEGYDPYDSAHHLQVSRYVDEARNIIQSLQQPKYPVAFECEMKQKSVNGSIPVNQEWEYEPKTITNSQGQTQLVGTYIYE